MSSFQAAAVRQGRQWEAAVEFMLLAGGFTIVERHARVAGVEIDLVVLDPDGSEEWIECKGSHRGKTPGLRRDDTVKKLLGVAYHLQAAVPAVDRMPYVCVTSHVPRPGTLGDRMLATAIRAGALARIDTCGMEST